MSESLVGKDISLWVETTRKTNYPSLSGDDAVYDLLVVGGGITGVVVAYEAQRQGLKTALIDKSRLIEWTTGGNCFAPARPVPVSAQRRELLQQHRPIWRAAR